jgi:hypothetical protein
MPAKYRQWADTPSAMPLRGRKFEYRPHQKEERSMSLKARLQELESRFRSGEILLQMEDGSVRAIYLPRGEDAADLFCRTLTHPHTEEARLIAESVSAVEPGGSRITEVIRALLNGPTETETIKEIYQ